MWPKFKTFFQKKFGDPQTFINSIWTKFRRKSQYQLEEAWDYISYFQHLQFILVEFGTIKAPNKPTIIYYFKENLKPFIEVEIE